DLACYSKAIANGMPLAVLAGRRDIMELCDSDVFFFTTFGGEALSLAAARATMNELRSRNVPDYLAEQGRKLKDGYNAIPAGLGMAYTACSGMDCRTMVTFAPSAGDPLELKSLLQQELIKRGVLWNGFHNLSFSHSAQDIAYTLDAYREALGVVQRAVSEGNVRGCLRGEPVEAVFPKAENFNVRPVTGRGPGPGNGSGAHESSDAVRSY